jgi:hypothetical protein
MEPAFVPANAFTSKKKKQFGPVTQRIEVVTFKSEWDDPKKSLEILRKKIRELNTKARGGESLSDFAF